MGDRRGLLAVLFAVIACGLLVAAASVVPLVGNPSSPGSLPGDGKDAKADPAAYALEATAEVARLASLPALAAPDLGDLSAADVAAAAAMQQETEAALAALEAAIAEAAATLPTVPAGYVVGTEVDVDLPAAQAYPLPSLPKPDLGLSAVQLQVPGVTDSTAGMGSGSELGGVLGQLEDLGSQLDGVLEDTPVGGIGGLPVEGLPVGPMAGGSPQQVQDADDTVEPDEAGAVSASTHARSALELTDGAYGTTAAELKSLLEQYGTLADRVEDALADVRSLQDKGEAGIQDALDERLADLEDQVAGLEAEAQRALDLHAEAVADARDTAADTISGAAAAQSAVLAKAGDAKVRGLQGEAQALQADVQQRKDAITALVAEADADLGASPDAQQALEAIQSAAVAATLKLDRDAQARVAALQAQADDVQGLVATSQSQLTDAADGALAQVDATAAAATAGDADVLGFLLAQAQAYADLMEAREVKLAGEAVALLQEKAEERSQAIVGDALDGASGAEAALGRTGGLVSQVQIALEDQVGKDLEYVAKVGDDYSRVPTEDRKARAAHWSGLAVDLTDALEEALGDGRAVNTLAAQALAAVREAQGEVSALA